MGGGGTVTKTVWQYSEALPEETMEFLRGIARDYNRVKDCVYGRYSGIGGLDRLAPAYGILNEMRRCGLRESLGLPSVYYELAVADAVADIRSAWGTVRRKVGALIAANGNLGADDRAYLRTVLRLDGVYAAVLNRREHATPRNAQGLDVDAARLDNLLRRLTRKCLTRPAPRADSSFRISPNGYSYGGGAIRVAGREPRRRVPIPLRDGRSFDRQILVRVMGDRVALAVPVGARVRRHPDYAGTVYVHVGYRDMLTLPDGTVYGEGLGGLVAPETERLARKNRERQRVRAPRLSDGGGPGRAERVRANNLGRLKYDRQKGRARRRTETFVNTEINRMLRTERPGRVVVAAPSGGRPLHGPAGRLSSGSYYGYIRGRLAYKCLVNSVELVEVRARGAWGACSSCGAQGTRRGPAFSCPCCGLEAPAAVNTARNIRAAYEGRQGAAT